MAEFCDECRAKMGAPSGPKSDEAITKELAKQHGSWTLLCEGCCSRIVYNREGERSVVPLPGHPSYRPGEGPAATAEYECLKCGHRVGDLAGTLGPCPACGGTLAATELVGMTDQQKEHIASELETDIRASLGASFKKVCGPGQAINPGTLFEIIGMALTKFARAVDAKGRGGASESDIIKGSLSEKEKVLRDFGLIGPVVAEIAKSHDMIWIRKALVQMHEPSPASVVYLHRQEWEPLSEEKEGD